MDMWSRWREKDFLSRLYMDTWREREAEEDLNGQCQGKPKRENIDLTMIGEANRNRDV